MPTLSTFCGIVIRMYYDDHAPPHLHAIYGSDEALVAIETLDLLEGRLPKRALALVKECTKMTSGGRGSAPRLTSHSERFHPLTDPWPA